MLHGAALSVTNQSPILALPCDQYQLIIMWVDSIELGQDHGLENVGAVTQNNEHNHVGQLEEKN